MLTVNLLAKKSFEPFAARTFRLFSTSNENRYNLMFFGTDDIAKTVLEALYLNKTKQFKDPVIDALEVTTAATTPGKKNISPVKLFCEEKKLSI